MTVLLEVRNLEVTYGEFAAVRGVSFEVRRGDLVTIIGANGAGKSTTLRAVMGLQRPRAGQILFDGADITTEPSHVRARRGISLVPEGRRILPDLTVEENLRLGAYTLPNAGEVSAALERAYTLFPRLRERARQRRKDALRRRTADAGHRPVPGQPPPAAPAGRGVSRPDAHTGRADLRRRFATCTARGPRSSWWSKMPAWPSPWPHGVTSWRRAPSPSSGSAAELAADPKVKKAYLGG